MRGKYLFIVIVLVVIQNYCLDAQITALWNADTSFYFYKINDENLVAEKILLDGSLNSKEILDSITSILSFTYFVPQNPYYSDKININVISDSIIIYKSDNKVFRIGIVNIQDPDKICMSYYFQGSTGGYITFLMLVSNLMQPQMETPLLDAVIFLYNDEELKEMDHINLEGVISEREIDRIVRKALRE